MNERIGRALTPLMRHPINTSSACLHKRLAELLPCGVCVRGAAKPRVYVCTKYSGREPVNDDCTRASFSVARLLHPLTLNDGVLGRGA
jgi:hypothetical protein